MNAADPVRPLISAYEKPAEYVRDMLAFRKRTEAAFSVAQATRALRRVSPALITLIVKGERRITSDRAEELAQLLKLTPSEKFYWKGWLDRLEGRKPLPQIEEKAPAPRSRKDVSTHILSDWINLYVKDAFQIAGVDGDPERIYELLAPIANRKRVDKAIRFLLKEGHLRRQLDGKIVVETNLTVTDPKISSQKIRQFHKNALLIARNALDLYPTHERLSNTLLVPLTEEKYARMLALVREFAEKLQEFASESHEPGERLYQVIVNLSPTGGKPK